MSPTSRYASRAPPISSTGDPDRPAQPRRTRVQRTRAVSSGSAPGSGTRPRARPLSGRRCRRSRSAERAPMRIAVIADPHLSVLRDGTASWHNPYRLADAHDRLDTALTDPLFDDADVFVILGDLAHFGDRESIR